MPMPDKMSVVVVVASSSPALAMGEALAVFHREPHPAALHGVVARSSDQPAAPVVLQAFATEPVQVSWQAEIGDPRLIPSTGFLRGHSTLERLDLKTTAGETLQKICTLLPPAPHKIAPELVPELTNCFNISRSSGVSSTT